MTLLEGIGGLLAIAGALIVLAGAVGIVRLPDVFTRMHAAGVVDSLGAGLVLIGLALADGFTTASARLVMILAFLWITSPTACHALAKSALASGVEPWIAPTRPEAGGCPGDERERDAR